MNKRCIGLILGQEKGLRRCELPRSSGLYCHKHKRQPIYFAVMILVAVCLTGIPGSYLAALIPLPRRITHAEKLDDRAASERMAAVDLRLAPRLENYRSRVALMHGLYNGSHEVPEGFNFAALGELFNNILNPDGLLPERVRLYELYLSSHQKLRDTVAQCIADVDRFRYPEVADLLEEFLRTLDGVDVNDLHHLFDHAVKEEREVMIDGKLERKVPRQLQIAHHDLDGKDHPSILDPYVELYRLMNASIRFRKRYDSAISEIRAKESQQGAAPLPSAPRAGPSEGAR